MKTNCELIKDLIPAYCRNECSDNNRKLVEEHLFQCPDCKKYLDDYSVNEINEEPETEKRIIESFKQVKRKLRLKCLKVVIFTLIGLLVIFNCVKYSMLQKEVIFPYKTNGNYGVAYYGEDISAITDSIYVIKKDNHVAVVMFGPSINKIATDEVYYKGEYIAFVSVRTNLWESFTNIKNEIYGISIPGQSGIANSLPSKVYYCTTKLGRITTEEEIQKQIDNSIELKIYE